MKNFLFILQFLFIIFNYYSTVCCQSSTIYIDGENDMTVPVQVSGAEIKKIRSQMLDAFGIKSPSKSYHAPDKFVSRYMTSLYKFLGHNNEVIFNPSFRYLDKDTGTTDFDFNKILSDSDQFDSIVGFVPETIIPNPKVSRSIGSNVIEYDFASEAAEDSLSDESLRLVHAELYFAVENDSIPLEAIKLYSPINDNQFKEISGIQTIRMNDTQLLAINVTKIVQSWILFPTEDRKLYVKIEIGENNFNDLITPLEELIPDLHCFGVGFFVETNDEDFAFPPNRIQKREAPSENDIVDDSESEGDEDNNDIPVFSSDSSTSIKSSKNNFDILAKPRVDSCRVRTLFIDFNAIGWGEFVVAPSGYRANYCDGGCPFPLDMKFNPSNHATVQTLIHLIDKNKTGEALCAPSLMDKPLSFLFIDNNQVKIKKYLDMSVIQCGCQ